MRNHDYLASTIGPQASDTVLHSPPKGNRYDNLSHVTICYDEPPPQPLDLGTKFHDRDTDGVLITTTVRSGRSGRLGSSWRSKIGARWLRR